MINFYSYYSLLTENHFRKIVGHNIQTVGIITAENPTVKTGYTNSQLEYDLEDYKAIKMRGNFAGSKENPFLVININKPDLIELAKKYKQKSVIFGEKKKEFVFKLIENGKIVKSGNLGGKGDCHFTLSGIRFSIDWN